MRRPPADISSVLWAAASQYGIPYTLLCAVAYRESQYDASATSKPNKTGQIDRGLFQLSPATLQTYNVTDPYDASESARAASQMLVHLGHATDWDWKLMLWSYNYGPTAVARLVNAGNTPPMIVQQYADSVIGNRRWLQAQDAAAGSGTSPSTARQQRLPFGAPTTLEKLDAAITALSQLNPMHNDSAGLAVAWHKWYVGTKRDLGDAALVDQAFIVLSWNNYARAFDRAPLTNSSTPTPDYINPSLWNRIKDRTQTSIAIVREAVNAAKASAAQVTSWWYGSDQAPWLLLLGGGALLFALSSRSRGRRSSV